MLIDTLDLSIEINIPGSASTIGLMLSGGMDSALLGYLLLKEINEKKLSTKISFFNVPNDLDNADTYSNRIKNYYEKHFNKSIKLISVGKSGLPHNKIINYGAKIAINYVDVLYSGVNQNPPLDIGVAGPIRRSPNLPDEPNAKFPFVKLYKTHILEIYKQLDIIDLAYIAHSCTESKYSTCNHCFQCKERQWAFDSLGIENKFIQIKE